MQGRSDAVRRASPASRLERAQLALAASRQRRPLARTVLLTIAVGLAAGAYTLKLGWSIHHGL